MSHVIIRGANGRRHEVDFGDAGITVSLHASAETVELAIEADDPDRPSRKRRFALVNVPRHLFSKAKADLARQDRGRHARVMTDTTPATEVLAGLVERVTFHDPETGFCVLRVKARGHRDLVTTVGHAAMISAREQVVCSSRDKRSPARAR